MLVSKIRKEDFFRSWTSEMAYTLGFFAADGSMYRAKHGGYYIAFEVTDLDILLAIRAVLSSEHKISSRKRNARYKTIYRLQIGSKRVFNDLIGLGMHQAKSLTMRMPQIPSDFLADFIRGYFDGDGCVHFGKYWRKDRRQWKLQLSIHFTSGSKGFLEDLWAALRIITAGGHIAKKERGYELVFGQHDAVAIFHLMYDNGSELFLKRKYQKFQLALRTISLRS